MLYALVIMEQLLNIQFLNMIVKYGIFNNLLNLFDKYVVVIHEIKSCIYYIVFEYETLLLNME